MMDHLAYRWVTRTRRRMYSKIGLTVSSSAGAPPKSVTKSMARQLKWMGVANAISSRLEYGGKCDDAFG
ncbi:MAG: hypothetical protein ACLS48_11195 [[Eubacterium] siraeum]